jgi:tRNA nucleotidyltransferase (CCA-adding enzyme)
MEVITTHINADFDCLGAMIAARKLYPRAELVFAGSQEKSLREFFVRSAVYAYDFKRIRDIDLAAVTRLILVDVRQSERIGPFGEVARREGVEVHIYDHHPAGQADIQGDLETIEPVGSTVTVLTHIFMERGIVPNPEEATMMMLGLYEDTGGLLFNSTTLRDFQAAAYLFTHGANLNTVADFLTQELTADQVTLLHKLIESRTVLNVRGIDISIAHASIDHFVGDLAVLAHKLKDMENLDALLVVVRMADRIFLVGRSRIPEVHVGEILRAFGLRRARSSRAHSGWSPSRRCLHAAIRLLRRRLNEMTLTNVKPPEPLLEQAVGDGDGEQGHQL